MKIAKEVIKKYSRWSEDLNEEVIPVSTLHKMLEELESKPFEDRLKELEAAMNSLSNIFTDLEQRTDD